MRATVEIETADGLRCEYWVECPIDGPLPERLRLPVIRGIGPLTDEQAMKADVRDIPIRHYKLSWSVPIHLRHRMPVYGIYREVIER